MKQYAEIFRIVWPLALGMVNNAVMQFVDRAFLSRFSMTALEAVLPASTLAWIFMSFFQSVTGYSGVFVSQYHGAGDGINVVRSYRVGLIIAAVSGIMTLPLVPLGNMIFAATAATGEVLALEKTYYSIVMLGGFFVFGQMAAAAYFTGRGKTRLVFWVSLAGNLVNIAVDPVLIFGWFGCPRLGMAGAALATVGSLAIQFAVLVFCAWRECRKIIVPRSFPAISGLMKRVLRFGIPSGAYEVLNMASFTIFVFVTGSVGEVAFAASNACFTINYLLYAPMAGFAIGAQTLVGQARGRGEVAEARRAAAKTVHLALASVAVMCTAVLLLHRPLLSLFVPASSPEYAGFMASGFDLLVLMCAWMLFDSTDTVVSGALKGAGDTKFVMTWMFVTSFLFWLPTVFLVRHFHNTMPALWATMVLYTFVICLGSLIRWKRGAWRKITIVENK